MKALRFHGSGRPLGVEDVTPPAPGEDDGVMRVAGCGDPRKAAARGAGGRVTDATSVRGLGAIVEGEARCMSSEAHLHPDPARVAGACKRHLLTDAVWAAGAVELYESLGFEVVADPVRPEEIGEACDTCRLLVLMQFRTIYAHRVTEAAPAEMGSRAEDVP